MKKILNCTHFKWVNALTKVLKMGEKLYRIQSKIYGQKSEKKKYEISVCISGIYPPNIVNGIYKSFAPKHPGRN